MAPEGAGLRVRELAAKTLYRVNHQGAWSNVLIEQELSRSTMASADKGLYVRLVRGCLERQGALDWALGFHVNRPIAKLDPWPREVLRLGAYQILYLDTPGFAAVDTSVSLAKHLAGSHVAGLVNAVLRKVAASKDKLPWPDRPADPVLHLSLIESHPRWLVERWIQRFGLDGAHALCVANNEPPGTTIRAHLLRTERQALMAELAQAGFTVHEGNLAPEAILVSGGGDLRHTDAYRAGKFVFQDEASMLAARALAPVPGERVIDACAAPGGKTTHLAALAGDKAPVLAMDVNAAKLSQVASLARRLGLHSVTTRAGDAADLGAIAPGGADALLLDAPCSGLGVIRRRPELRWRRSPADLPAIAEKQVALLTGVAAAIRPGGRLVYAVCSFEPEETDGVIARFLSSPAGRGWDIHSQPRTLLPHVDGTDGFFFAGLRRAEPAGEA